MVVLYLIKKSHPNDIDFVSFVDFKIVEDKEKLLDKQFRRQGVKNFYGNQIDAYICSVYPENHQKAFYTKSDVLEWQNQFSYTRPNRNKENFSKGFIKIKF